MGKVKSEIILIIISSMCFSFFICANSSNIFLNRFHNTATAAYAYSENLTAHSEFLLVLKNSSKIIGNETSLENFSKYLQKNKVDNIPNPRFGNLLVKLDNLTYQNITSIFEKNATSVDQNNIVHLNDTIVCKIILKHPDVKSCEPNRILPPPQ